jgi:hypothetical protein
MTPECGLSLKLDADLNKRAPREFKTCTIWDTLASYPVQTARLQHYFHFCQFGIAPQNLYHGCELFLSFEI